MNNLKVIENELVPVYETNTGEKVVCGTELHEVLSVKSNYRDWIKNRLNDCEAVENEDFQSFAKNLAKGGRPQNEHIIKLDTAKEMAMLERNDKGKQVRRYFIEVEKRYKTSVDQLSPQLQLLINMEIEQKRQAQELQEVKAGVQGMREIITLNPNSWREDTKRLIVKIAQTMGGNTYIKDIHAEVYKLLNQRMGVDLGIRLTNLRRRMADEGICKSKRDKVTKIDVIASDKKLIEGFIAIVKEMAIKYGVSEVA